MKKLIALAVLQVVSISHSVTLSCDPFPLSTPTNPGWLNFYRADKTGEFCAGSPQWIGHTAQTYVAGTAVPPKYTDTIASGSYCYYVSFIYTPSGTPTPVETELSDPLIVTVPTP